MVDPKRKKIAVGCQGGGMHAAFEIGVLTEILKDSEQQKFDLVGLSGTSAGALCALMAWYGLVPKNGQPGSERAAIDTLVRFWDQFVAGTPGETLLNLFTFGALKFEEMEIPVFGINAPMFGLNPGGAIYKTFAASLPRLGVRAQYYNLEDTLARDCAEFHSIDWPKVKTRLLIGASEVVNGLETVFDSAVNKGSQKISRGMQSGSLDYWRQQLPLTLTGIVASGTLPAFKEAERIDGCFYWDGLYSQNPPVREFFTGVDTEEVPDELWIVRINPQQWPEPPSSNAEVMDRENELMGNLSLHKELDFILTVNEWRKSHGGKFADDYKHVTVRTIKMKKETADELRYSSKFNRDRVFMDRLRNEGAAIAREWLDRWPNGVGSYPEDAAYP